MTTLNDSKPIIIIHEDQESTVNFTDCREIVIPPLVEPTRNSNADGSYYYKNDDGSTYYRSPSGKSYYKKPVAPLQDKERKENTKDSSQTKNLLEKAFSPNDNNKILIHQVNNELDDTKDAVVELAQVLLKQNAILVELIQLISTNAQDSNAGSISASVAPQNTPMAVANAQAIASSTPGFTSAQPASAPSDQSTKRQSLLDILRPERISLKQNTPVAVANVQDTASSTPGVTSAQPASAPSDQTKVESRPFSGPVSGPPVATTLTVQRADSMVDDQSSVTVPSIGVFFAPRRICLPTPVTTPVTVPVQNTSVEDTPGALFETVYESLFFKRVNSAKTAPAATPVPTLGDVLSKMEKVSIDTASGKYNKTVGNKDDITLKQKKLQTKLADLECFFADDIVPPGHFEFDALSCIPFNPEATFNKARKTVDEVDQWWTRLKYVYEIDVEKIKSDVFAVGGSNLDLHPRLNSNLFTYGTSLVNTYIPSSFIEKVVAAVEKTGKYQVVQGKEIIDDEQGLVSYLTATYPENVPFKVAVYTKVLDEITEEVVSMDHKYHTLSALYASAADNVDCRLFGGIAFVHVNITHSCAANAIDRHGTPPVLIGVEIKFKLVGFHGTHKSTHKVKQITYKKQQAMQF